MPSKKKPKSKSKSKSKQKKSAKNLVSICAHFVEHGAFLLFSVFNGLLLFVPQIWALIQLVVVGLVLLILRKFIIFISPFIARNASLFAFIFNAIIFVIEIVVFVIAEAVNLVFGIIKDIERAIPGIPVTKFPDIGDGKVHIDEVDSTEVRKRFNEISRECPKYNGLDKISDHITKQSLSPYLCPVIRVAKPLGWVGNATQTLLGPFSYNAEPYPGHRGHVKNINCEPPEDQDVAWSCVILGSGYFVLEVLIPSLIGGIFLFAMAGPILKLIGDFLALASYFIKKALHILFRYILRYV